jgi:hypothetical protein
VAREPDQPAEAGAVTQPGQQLVADDRQPQIVLLGRGLQRVQPREQRYPSLSSGGAEAIGE